MAENHEYVRFTCDEGSYNTLATLVFNTEGGIIRTLLRLPVLIKKEQDTQSIPVETILIFLFLWVLFTFVTYGIWVPAGLFLPGIIIGSCLGLLWMQVMLKFGLSVWVIGGQSYVIMGASAMLASYCRMTYSLAVIMLETT